MEPEGTGLAGHEAIFEAIRRSPETFRSLVESAGDGIMVADARTAALIYANAAMARLLGRSVPDLMRIPFDEIHPPSDLPWVREIFYRMARGELSVTSDIPMVRSDGRVVRFDVRGVPIELDGRRCLMGVFRDVSAVRSAQAELAESDRRTRTLLGNLPGMAYRCRNDRDWTMVFCSEGSRELLGVPPEEFLSGRSAYNEFIHPDDRERVWSEVQAALDRGDHFQLRYRIRDISGREKHTWERGRGVLDRSGRLEALEGFIMDVSDLVLATQRAEDLNRALELAMETTRSMAFENDLVTGEAGLSSKALFRAMGYADDEIQDTKEFLSSLVHPEDLSAIWEAIERHARGETPTYQAEYRARAKDGSWWLIGATGTITERTEDGRPRKLVGMAMSLQDRQRGEEERLRLLAREREARRQAEAAVQLRDEFISVAAHELKTPVSTLQIALERLRARGTEGLATEAAARSLEIAERQAQRLVRLVNGLLDLTRLATGRFELQREAFDMSALVQEVLLRNEAILVQSGCSLDASGVRAVKGSWDRTRIEQVIENLLVNAMKFGRGGAIHVALEQRGDYAWLTVRDHGIGIAPGQEERIFEAYERGGSERHFGGLGMGLYISRAIVQTHGGTIRAVNHADGGAIFTVELPLG